MSSHMYDYENIGKTKDSHHVKTAHQIGGPGSARSCKRTIHIEKWCLLYNSIIEKHLNMDKRQMERK